MKLASLKVNNRDGKLVVISRDLSVMQVVTDIAPTLQAALDDWQRVAPLLKQVYQTLNDNPEHGQAFDPGNVAAPLPRAYQWLDGSAYLSHVERVRKARGAELPHKLYEDPLMYQGCSDTMLGARDPITQADDGWGIDFEAEVAIITDDVPMGVTVESAASYINLVMLINDISLRNLIPCELAKGFGFVHGKPASACSPVAVTPEELGSYWQDSKVHLPMRVNWNGQLFGQANAGIDMQFNFAELIHHAAKSRCLTAGTIIGSGTVSNHDLTVGCSCIVEKRVLEIIESGAAYTEYMSFGDTVEIDMIDGNGQSVFGAIKQQVIQA